jgi:hypothetical protein
MKIGIGLDLGRDGVALKATSYSNPGGSGNRTGLITISTNHPLDPGGPTIGALIDGSFAGNSTNSCGFLNAPPTTLNGTQYIRVDFGSNKRVTEVKFSMDRNVNEGIWKIQISPDNFTSSIVDISANTAVNVITNIFNCSSNVRSWRYLQMLGVSGVTDFAPWLTELEFKLA